MKLDQALENFIVEINTNEGKSPRTVSSYTEDLEEYFSYLTEQGIKETKQIDDGLIESFLAVQAKNKKPASIARMSASIRSFHHFMTFRYDENDPSLNIEVHRGIKSLPVFATVNELNRLMDSFDDSDPKQMLDHAILEMIYTCGLRVSEACNMTSNRVNLETGIVREIGRAHV